MAAHLSLSAQVGQLLMVAVRSTQLSSADARTVVDVRAGSVILLGNSTRGVAATKRLVSDVRAAARPPKGVQTLVAADQEGGLVQRLKGPGFVPIPSAEVQSGWSDAKLAERAAVWGAQLAKAGIDVNLAPVADVVPTSMEQVNQPIGLLHRGYGPSPAKVAAKTTAFNRGMQRAGIATGAKHFPGLGRVRGNTDFSADVVDSVTTRHDAGLAGFRALVRDHVDMVMVSSATYAKIDRRQRAAFSPTVLGSMLRGDLGFTGVVISDDLSAAALRDVAPGQRAVRFVAAGGDLAIVGNPRDAPPMASALQARAKQDPRFAQQVTRSTGRVLAMKARSGQAGCSPG
jgi:beta-N-acetylhexosaminidase